uniref:NADH-ubiquinone oxidoreductase chain 2 n=1 Tax=Zophobas atratus TaxID=7074 RepID=A0A410P8C1_ZOPAT|nr:NADH dehydrogenase subunit 2 [Zophobas atratus]QAT19097.1 NADH dehydrogenase subunit 2 [Zophobas atratus]
MKIYKIVFINSMIMGTLIAISSYSWLSMWMGLEINLLSVIPLFSDSKNMFSSESSMKYFITQAMASLILLMAVMMTLTTQEFINPLMNFYFSMMITTALMTKLGAAPFHFWFPEVIEGLNWNNSLILLTWQKIAPMMLIMNINLNELFLVSMIIISLLTSTISGFNQISLRKILAFSSINHIAWMLSTSMMSLATWSVYFIIYSIMNINIIAVFATTKSFYLNQIINIMNNSKMTKFSIMMNFMSLGGLPPFIGFLPKWIVINWMTENNFILLTILMIVTTLIMLFIYIRVMMSSMIISINEPKTSTIKFNNKNLMTINIITLLSLILSTLIINIL